MKTETLVFLIVGMGIIVLAAVIYDQGKQITQTTAANMGNLNQLSGQISSVLSNLGIKSTTPTGA